MAAAFRFLRFAAGDIDTIWLGDRRAFLLALPDRPPVFVDGICPHRGGPLGLGEYDCATASLLCPWHGRRRTRQQLLAGAWPALRVGTHWVVALPMASSDAGSACIFRRGQLTIRGPNPSATA